jgi:threonylcarbamoyladenosine tRNA methylthiotransferase MtaB
MPNPVPKHERAERSKMLHILSDKKRRKFYEENLGTEAVVLFENDIENGMMHGFTENYIRVIAKYDPMLVNDLKKVRLASIHESGLVALEEVSTDVFVH